MQTLYIYEKNIELFYYNSISLFKCHECIRNGKEGLFLINANVSLHLVNEETQNRGEELFGMVHIWWDSSSCWVLSASSSLEAPVWRHRVTRDRHLPQPRL